MGSAKTTLIALLMILGLSHTATATTYLVGGATGWNLGVPATFFDDWAKAITFHAGDVLDFSYPGTTHNVFQVSAAELASCNYASPSKIYETAGGDKVTLTAPGTYYFICGIPGHCLANMKLTVVVSAAAPAPAPSKKAPAPAPSKKSPAPAPSKLHASTPAASTEGGSSSHRSGLAVPVGALVCIVASLLFQ